MSSRGRDISTTFRGDIISQGSRSQVRPKIYDHLIPPPDYSPEGKIFLLIEFIRKERSFRTVYWTFKHDWSEYFERRALKATLRSSRS